MSGLDLFLELFDIAGRVYLIYSIVNYFVMNPYRKRLIMMTQEKLVKEQLKPEVLHKVDEIAIDIYSNTILKKKIGVPEHIQILDDWVMIHPRLIEELELKGLKYEIISFDKKNKQYKLKFWL